MAYMIPDNLKDQAPLWERILFNRFRSELDDEIIVLHSLGIARHRKKRWGECDFVLITPEGILFLEVKGGGVQCLKGKWIYTSPNGKAYTKNESPWEQAKNAMYSIKQDLERNHPELRNILFGFGVVIPDDEFTETGPEIEQEYLLDRRNWHFDLSHYVKKLTLVWIERHSAITGSRPGQISRRQREIIRKALRPDSVSIYTLASRLNYAEKQLVELTSSQIRAIQGLQDNKHVIVEGAAGTGKTLLAFDQAGRFAGEGLKVLYLCFSRLLAAHMKTNVMDLVNLTGNIAVSTLHTFFNNAIANAGYGKRLTCLEQITDKDDFYKTVFPRLFQEAVLEKPPDMYDVLIIDEAQDILSVENLEALDLVLNKGFRKSNWQIYLDKMQNIYNPDNINEALTYLEEKGYAKYRLTVNCRNTIEVAVLTSVISGIDMALKGVVTGGYQKSVYFKDGQFKKTIEALLEELHAQGLRKEDIILLSTRQFDKSSLSEIGSVCGKQIVDLTKESLIKGYDFCTMHAFKGLERKMVIATDVFDRGIPDSKRKILCYSGLSRAMTGIIILVNEKDKPEHEKLIREFGARLTEITL
jgi:ATP:corrinoid adenosyltransferase